MKERPILFSAPMVRAILAGQKTQTRRLVKGTVEDVTKKNEQWHADKRLVHTPRCQRHYCESVDDHEMACGGYECAPDGSAPRHPFGDRLWVRETWQAWNQVSIEFDEWTPITRETRQGICWAEWVDQNGKPDAIEYRADEHSLGPWTPSIHMPRWASRITLDVVSVRVERLQAISETDAAAEGVRTEWTTETGENLSCSAREAYAELWDDINGAGSWAANPWVWVIEFKPLAVGISPTE